LRPSRNFRKNIKQAVGESDFILGVKHDLALAESVKEGMESKFGAALYTALEAIERRCFNDMGVVSPFRVLRQVELRAELYVVRYIKNTIDTYVISAEALARNMKELERQGEDEWNS